MRIDRLTVANFRNLASVDLPLSRGTVVVGENRTGKTNLLHALRLLLDPTLPNSDRYLRREDFWDGLSDGSQGWDPMAAGHVIEISVEIADFADEPPVVTALGDALIEGEPMRARLTYRWAPRDVGLANGSSPPAYRWAIVGGVRRDGHVPADLRAYLFLNFLHSLRDVEADIRSWRRSPLRGLLEAAAAAADEGELESVRAAMQQANDQLNQLDAIQILSHHIGDRTREMVGDNQALETDLSVAPPDPLRLIRSMRLFVDGPAQRDLSSASLGTLNVLYLALLELGLEQRLAVADVAHVILAVDEPEAHLHPHLQRLIFRRLLSEDAVARTSLVTTQSPYIASVAPPQSLVVLRTVGDRTEAAAASTAQLVDAEWADLARYLDATRAELVFARRVLFVEGYAEQVLLPRLASGSDLYLDKLGITVCAIHGTHFATYVRFAEALRLPWAVLTDGDPDSSGTRRGDTRAAALLQRLDLTGQPAAHGVFVGDITFECDIFITSDHNRTTFCKTLDELAATPAQHQTLANWATQPPDCAQLLKFIDAVGGKGRVAQRLSIRTLDAPTYVSQALAHLEAQ